MRRTIHVSLGETAVPVGIIRHDAQGAREPASFEYINPFPDRMRELKTWISEDAGPAASIGGLMSVAPYFRIDRKRARGIVRDVESTVGRWREEGRAIGMSAVELDQLADAFEHEERDAARNLP